MITSDKVLPLLVETCPSFQPDPDDKELLYVVLGDFARHLLNLYRQRKTDGFAAAARLIERLHVEGDSYVKEAATIGLLEGIQNVWSGDDVDPEAFGTYLLPESRAWWDKLNMFWNGEREGV